MRLVGAKGISNFARWAQSRFTPGGVILLYHRVSEPDGETLSDPFSLCVSPENFKAHLECIQRIAMPLRLSDMTDRVTQDRLPVGSIALTFDDGYQDTLLCAAPLLDHYEIPATVFVVTDAVGGTFWWDRLVAILRDQVRLPPTIELEIGASVFRWNRPSSSGDSDRRLLRALHRALRSQPGTEVGSALERLGQLLETSDAFDSVPPALSLEELGKLASIEQIELGSHSVSHIPFSGLSDEQQSNELRASRDWLHEISGQPIESFSYPFGTARDFDNRSTPLLTGLGYKRACTNITGVVAQSADPLRLPRLWVDDCCGEVFEKRLRRWLRT